MKTKLNQQKLVTSQMRAKNKHYNARFSASRLNLLLTCLLTCLHVALTNAVTFRVTNLSGTNAYVVADQTWTVPVGVHEVEVLTNVVVSIDVGTIGNTLASVDLTTANLATKGQFNVQCSETDAHVVQTYTLPGWFLLGFGVGFAWWGIGFTFRIVRQIGRTTPEI